MDNGDISIGVLVDNETVWLTQAQMTALFAASEQRISLFVATIITILMIFPTYGLAAFGLVWCIPMLILTRSIRDGIVPNKVEYGVCCLGVAGILPICLFGSILLWGVGLLFSTGIVPGILLLVAKKDGPKSEDAW